MTSIRHSVLHKAILASFRHIEASTERWFIAAVFACCLNLHSLYLGSIPWLSVVGVLAAAGAAWQCVRSHSDVRKRRNVYLEALASGKSHTTIADEMMRS